MDCRYLFYRILLVCSATTLTEAIFVTDNYPQPLSSVRRSHINVTRVFTKEETIPFKRIKPLRAHRKLHQQHDSNTLGSGNYL